MEQTVGKRIFVKLRGRDILRRIFVGPLTFPVEIVRKRVHNLNDKNTKLEGIFVTAVTSPAYSF